MPDASSDLFVEVMTGVVGWPVITLLFDGFTDWALWPCVFAGLIVAAVIVLVMRG
jgi:hypothetical protein